MQFITNGPDIPDALLQAHEEGRVVFFCGAGISYPAGLPGFAELVDKLYSDFTVKPNAVQQAAIQAEQFDTAISLLEANIVGGRESVRLALAAILTPDLTAENATNIHESLLTLSKLRDGRTRLITTNFDRVFEEVIASRSLTVERFLAPLLPIPKNRWDGLVYLHGVLSPAPTASELDRLVISSGDFGLAYLTERWAARFASELFRNYSICFIGYSINDPVLRYMMDALAADKLLGEATPEMFAFGSYSNGRKDERANEWLAKNVTPILYLEHNCHAYLRQTLQAWAETYRDGIQGKEAIVVKHALTRPQESTQQDDYVGRMLWALSDKSGLPAKRFADFNPVPSLDWLQECFAHKRFGHSDLQRFGVSPDVQADTKLSFSLIQRPSRYDLARPMQLVSEGWSESEWDEVMLHLARWLGRHMDDPRLIIWIAERGGKLHNRWSWLIENELDRFASLEREGKTSDLNEIRLHAPKAIPGPQMRTLWRLLLSGRVKSMRRDLYFNLYGWKKRLGREGLTTTLRLELRELLAPKVILKKPFRWGGDDSSGIKEPTRIKQLVDWELALTADHVNDALRDFSDEHWTSLLPQLIDDFQLLLRDALDLLSELGEANDSSDRSHWDLPSITPHWQNRGFRDWVSLIELLRDAWLAIHAKDSSRAARIAQNWFELPYPTFKRLALFAASQENCISPAQWGEWLLSENGFWLWSTETGREVLRLFALRGHHLVGDTQEHLEAVILAGPPLALLMGQPEPDWWNTHVSRSIWLRLVKLKVAGLTLSNAASSRLEAVSAKYPKWQSEEPFEREEFSQWMSGTGDPDYEDSPKVQIAPSKDKDLKMWLSSITPEQQDFYKHAWREHCKRKPLHCFFALKEVTKSQKWLPTFWNYALHEWSNGKQVQRIWRITAPWLEEMADIRYEEISHALTFWIEAVSKSITCHVEIFQNLCSKVLNLQIDAGSGITRNGNPIDEPVTEAINHPIGHVARALINLWFKMKPYDNDLLNDDLKNLFTLLCDVQVDRFRHGRVILSSQLIAFFRVDRAWTEQYLLPLFSWPNNHLEAKAVWEGFLWSPRLYEPLLISFKSQFLETAKHYLDLGEHRQQFAAFLTYAALDLPEGYSVEEFRTAFADLTAEGIGDAALALSQLIESAADQSEAYWKNRVQPFWQKIWPKSRKLATPRIAESLIRLAIAARGEFPAALDAVQHWLKPIEHPDLVVNLLYESDLCSKYPVDALSLLSTVITDQLWVPVELGQCLEQIKLSQPALAQNPQYTNLKEYLRKRNR
jgi:SIR2-like domain